LKLAALCKALSELLAFKLGTNIKIIPRTEDNPL